MTLSLLPLPASILSWRCLQICFIGHRPQHQVRKNPVLVRWRNIEFLVPSLAISGPLEACSEDELRCEETYFSVHMSSK